MLTLMEERMKTTLKTRIIMPVGEKIIAAKQSLMFITMILIMAMDGAITTEITGDGI